jgi:hypothetical protein
LLVTLAVWSVAARRSRERRLLAIGGAVLQGRRGILQEPQEVDVPRRARLGEGVLQVRSHGADFKARRNKTTIQQSVSFQVQRCPQEELDATIFDGWAYVTSC